MDTYTDKLKRLIADVLGRYTTISEQHVLFLQEHARAYERTVFTSKCYHSQINYEMNELLGDAVVGKFLVQYFALRFPQLVSMVETKHYQKPDQGMKIITKLKAVYGSKTRLAEIARSLGFHRFINATEERRATSMPSLLEDTFEAFFGLTERLFDAHYGAVGVGYAVCYKILSGIFDEIPVEISYDNLYDSKSRLKELVDQHHDLHTIKYASNGQRTVLSVVVRGEEQVIGSQGGNNKKEQEMDVASRGLQALAEMGYENRNRII